MQAENCEDLLVITLMAVTVSCTYWYRNILEMFNKILKNNFYDHTFHQHELAKITPGQTHFKVSMKNLKNVDMKLNISPRL